MNKQNILCSMSACAVPPDWVCLGARFSFAAHAALFASP